MQAKHTPGPWTADGAGVYTGSPQNDNIVHIATAHFYGVPGDPMANAALIAAAPDMLEALRHALERFEAIPEHRDEIGVYRNAARIVRDAIARATGEA